MRKASVSRRSFLRAGSTTIVTAGVSGVPAVAATSGGLAKSAVATGGITKILQKLGTDGGFPFRSISSLFHNFKGKTPEEIRVLQQRILGVGDLYRYDEAEGASKDRHGKICIDNCGLIRTLMDMPQDIPIKDLFGADMTSSVSQNSKFDGEQIDMILKVLNPICNNQTTAEDLTQSYLEYFKKVARHAIKTPEDFFYTKGSGPHRFLMRGPEFKDVHSILEDFSDDSEIKALNDQLMKTMQQTNRRQEQQDTARWEKNQKDHEDAKIKKERTEEEEKQKSIAEPNNRKRNKVRLTSMGEDNLYKIGYFDNPSVDRPDGFPAWVDWYHLVSEISPNNAKPSDVKVSALGMLVSFNSKAMVEYILSLKTDEHNKDSIIVELPNRRSGIDLNYPRKLDI